MSSSSNVGSHGGARARCLSKKKKKNSIAANTAACSPPPPTAVIEYSPPPYNQRRMVFFSSFYFIIFILFDIYFYFFFIILSFDYIFTSERDAVECQRVCEKYPSAFRCLKFVLIKRFLVFFPFFC